MAIWRSDVAVGAHQQKHSHRFASVDAYFRPTAACVKECACRLREQESSEPFLQVPPDGAKLPATFTIIMQQPKPSNRHD